MNLEILGHAPIVGARAGVRRACGYAPRAPPDGAEAAGSGGRPPRSMRLSSGLWKSLPREARRSNSRAVVGVALGLGGGVAAGDDLDAAAAVALELGEERVLLGRRELVARRMGDDRDAAGIADPGHRVLQRRPAVRHEARLAFDQEAAEHLLRVGADAALDQVAREVGARDEVGVADVAQRAFVGCRRCRPWPARRPSRARAPRGRRASPPGRGAGARRRCRRRGRRCARWCRGRSPRSRRRRGTAGRARAPPRARAAGRRARRGR